jgi:hypothetical protein
MLLGAFCLGLFGVERNPVEWTDAWVKEDGHWFSRLGDACVLGRGLEEYGLGSADALERL